MRPRATAGQLEQRRRQAIRLRQRGKTVTTIAQRVGAGQRSVWRWLQTYQRYGLPGLRARPISGRSSYLSAGQKEHLARVLLRGAQAAGYQTELWTLQRIAKVIWKEFRVRYHPHALWHLFRAMGWSCQKPERRSGQRDEAAIAYWRRSRWPHIKKAAQLGAHLVFLDESGFLLIPNLKRPWAPQGQTPSCPVWDKQGRVNAFNAVAVSPKRKRVALYVQFHRRTLRACLKRG